MVGNLVGHRIILALRHIRPEEGVVEVDDPRLADLAVRILLVVGDLVIVGIALEVRPERPELGRDR